MADPGQVKKEDESRKLLKKDHDIDITFHQLKNEKSKVSLDQFIKELQSAGIIVERDKRFKELYKNCLAMSDGGCFKETQLSYEDYYKLVEEKKKLIAKCLSKKMKIENFSEFSTIVDVLHEFQQSNVSGQLSNEFPELSQVNVNLWGVAICSVDGQRKFVGNSNAPFTLQNLSKPLILGLVLKKVGMDAIKQYLAFEPNNVAKDIIELNHEGKPFNSMANTGAIMLCALLTAVAYKGRSVSYIHEAFINYVKDFIAGEYIDFKASSYISKMEAADELRCLGYGIVCSSPTPPECDIATSLDLFLKASSIEVTAESLSIIAATLANGGVNPFTEKRVLLVDNVKEILSAMYSFGLYQFSGESSFAVGLPMKSSISGGLLLVIPDKMGVAMYSPLLNDYGISDRSYHFSKEFVNKMKFHNFDYVSKIVVEKFSKRRVKSTVCEPYCEILTAGAANDVSKLLRLKDQKADFYAMDFFGHTVLHVAAAKGSFEAVKFVLNNFPSLVNVKDKWNRTPKTYAMQMKYYEIAKYLERFDESQPS